MAVEIPISANTSQTEAALRRLQAEFDRLRQAGKRFSEIDLSQATGRLKSDLEAVLKNYEALTDPKLGRQFARGLKASGQQGRDPWEWDFRAMYPTATEAQLRARQEQMYRSLLRGTEAFGPLGGRAPPGSALPPAGLPAGRPPTRGADDGLWDAIRGWDFRRTSLAGSALSGAGGILKRIAGAGMSVLGGLGIPLGLGAAGVVGVTGAYRQAREVDELMRRTKDVGQSFAWLRDQATLVGKNFGVSADKSAEMVTSFQKVSQTTDAMTAMTGTRTAVGLAYGMGLDKDQTVASMAQMQLLGAMGTGGDLSVNQKRFAMLIGQTAARGGVAGDKVLSDLSRSVEAFSQNTLQAPVMKDIAGLWQALYETSRDQHQPRPGLLGAGGQSLVSAVESGFPAAAQSTDPAVQDMIFRALSKLLGTRDPLRIQQQMERGPWAQIGASGSTNISAMVQALRATYGQLNPLATARALTGMFPGIGTIDRAQALIDINDRFGTRRGGTDFGTALSRYGVDWKTLDVSAIKDLADLVARPDMASVKAKYRGWQPHTPVRDSEKAELDRLEALAGQGNAKADQEFYEKLVQSVAKHGAAATPYTTMETLLTDVKDTLITHVGVPLMDNLPKLVDSVGQIKDWLTAPAGSSSGSSSASPVEQAQQELSRLLQNALDNPRAPDFAQRLTAFTDKYRELSGTYGQENFANLRQRLAPNWAEWLFSADAARARQRADIELSRQGMQEGGQIPGYGGGDKVPAMLEPGEFVVNKHAARTYQSVLASINESKSLSMPGFGTGLAGWWSRRGGVRPKPLRLPPTGDRVISPQAPVPHGNIMGAPSQSASGFVRSVWPEAQKVAAELGIPPEYIVGQAALESNWGRSIPRSPGLFSHNLFGIKQGKGWAGPVVYNMTGEETSGGRSYTERAAFRAYPSYADSIRDYLSFLRRNPRYEKALAAAQTGSGNQYVRELRAAGYATDTKYVQKVLSRVEQVRKIAGGSYIDASGLPPMATPVGYGPQAGGLSGLSGLSGPSALDVTVHINNQYGDPIAVPVRSRLDLRQPRTHGAVHMQEYNVGGGEF